MVRFSFSAPFSIGALDSKRSHSQERSGESECFVGGTRRALSKADSAWALAGGANKAERRGAPGETRP